MTSSNSNLIWAVACVTVAVAVSGCEGESASVELPESVRPVAMQPSRDAKRETVANRALSTDKEQATATPTDDSVPAEFTPPFPQRTNLFQPPKTNTVAKLIRQRGDERDDQPLLKGFVNVNGRKALLRLDGKLWVATEGESKNGICLVKLNESSVVLRRDGAEWAVSLKADNSLARGGND